MGLSGPPPPPLFFCQAQSSLSVRGPQGGKPLALQYTTIMCHIFFLLCRGEAGERGGDIEYDQLLWQKVLLCLKE